MELIILIIVISALSVPFIGLLFGVNFFRTLILTVLLTPLMGMLYITIRLALRDNKNDYEA